MYKLVIVESPAKAKTIEKYLGSGFIVKSSVGHIRDLATSGYNGYGIDIEDNFNPHYKYITGKKKVVQELKKFAKDASFVYLATDPDREGEAIAWHLADELNIDLGLKNRVYFNEITKKGIEFGMENVTSLNMDLINSQETRRKIDRIIGFDLSKVLKKKIDAKSAGRVQSVALQLIVHREKEIENFVAEKYYKLFAGTKNFQLEWEKNSKKASEIEVNEALKQVEKLKVLQVTDIKKTKKNIKPKLAYTTSTFQQDAYNKLNIGSKKAMSIAQKLYEGIDIEGIPTGLITYMRTDSTRLSQEFIDEVNVHLTDKFGNKYVGSVKKSKTKKTVQDAHEAIRPTSIFLTPSDLEGKINKDELKIYKLIYDRCLASLMASSIQETTNYEFKANGVVFQYVTTSVLFDGYLKVMQQAEDKNVYNFQMSEEVKVDEFKTSEHFTQPKPRYNESSLVKILEESGVGRPSTYATIIDIIKKRGYVDVTEKRFIPTEMGTKVITNLDQYFESIINVTYTSDLEGKLDKIAEGNQDYLDVLTLFYEELKVLIENAMDKMPDKEVKYTGNICPNCSSKMVMRSGKFGEFEACSNFPKCKYIVIDEKDFICDCPKCTNGKIIEKRTKRGKVFYACNKYPKCDFAKWSIEEVTGDKI